MIFNLPRLSKAKRTFSSVIKFLVPETVPDVIKNQEKELKKAMKKNQPSDERIVTSLQTMYKKLNLPCNMGKELFNEALFCMDYTMQDEIFLCYVTILEKYQ